MLYLPHLRHAWERGRGRAGMAHLLAIDKVPLAALFNPQKVCKVNLCCASKAHRQIARTRMYIYHTIYIYICVFVCMPIYMCLHAVPLNWVPSVDSETTTMMIFLCQRRHFCLIWKSAVFLWFAQRASSGSFLNHFKSLPPSSTTHTLKRFSFLSFRQLLSTWRKLAQRIDFSAAWFSWHKKCFRWVW